MTDVESLTDPLRWPYRSLQLSDALVASPNGKRFGAYLIECDGPIRHKAITNAWASPRSFCSWQGCTGRVRVIRQVVVELGDEVDA